MPVLFLNNDEYVSAVVEPRLPEAWRERMDDLAAAPAAFVTLLESVVAVVFFWGMMAVKQPFDDCELLY